MTSKVLYSFSPITCPNTVVDESTYSWWTTSRHDVAIRDGDSNGLTTSSKSHSVRQKFANESFDSGVWNQGKN